ncbi:efflux RND transporter periplasmic adaptor subunit [Aeromonas dhakensis]|uniref:efflux RND transporter periplasmic adaptor subunit n=1 Tax=Aeromonas TaxID=642 RepID=UPI000543847C|nr:MULTISPECIES: efflux RND transporter periplasmic adaptor subunit [Aeromonas]AZU49003.1 hemolysin secretion protein D [Aeromonas hydrophila]KHE14108.1 hemolysin secretion protein D [Aeromonas hydrophila]MCV3291154.1 efflux RND transporter periplasmic adaptor subunit [Aeromonas hydrophila]MDD9305435.1 efflux RND transporter periplasmic adaptor subunit [Aeromonas hydrophila]OSP49803.1 efflux transporter periplasmic adaptor subunit [Aeromonas hydrophila]
MNITPQQRKIALLTLAPLLAIGWLLWPSKTPEPVLTAQVTRQDVEQTVLASGVLQAIEQVDVGAQVSGQVTYLAVEAGQKVKQGDLLAEIDPLIAQNNLKTAEAELASNRAQLKIKQAQLKQNELAWRRQQQMFKQEASSRADLESAEALLAVTRAELQNSQANIDSALIKVDRARTELGYTKILAPMDGTVISIVTRQGQTLAASQTVPTVLKLANLETMTVKAQISEADVTKVKAGMPVYFTLIGDPDTRYQGTLRAVELAPTNINDQAATGTTTNNAAVYYYALFNVPNPGHTLRVAMTTQVTIVLGERKQVLTVPQTALGKSLGDNEYEVTVIKEDETTETRHIKTGMKDEIRIEVVSGLTEKEEVQLNHGTSAANDEMAVML